jgi:hypothetical protein
MPSTYTTNGGIELPANGEQSGTWGETVNDNMAIIDRLTNGVGAISLSGTTHTLTTADGTLSDGQYNVLVLGGSPSGTNTITISPNDGEHVYVVKNASGQTATFTQGSGANVSVINNTTKIIYADGAGAGAAVVDITGALDLGSLIIAGTTTITAVLDEDNMASDSATALATQQSIKAYVDAQVGTVDTLAEILAIGNTTGATDIAVDSAQKVQFRDAAIYINSSVDGQLDIVADTEIQIAATTVDVNGALDVSGTALVTGVLTTTAATVSNGGGQFNGAINVGVDDTGYDVKFFGATTGKSLLWDESADSLIVTGTTTLVGTTNLDAVDIDGATQIDATVTVGVDDTGYDVKFFGATAGAYMLWDESADTLEVSGTITVDGLTVDGSVSITDAVNAKLSLSGPISSIDMYDTSSVNSNTRFESHSNGLFIKSLNDDGTATQYIIELNCSNGNIIFFDDTSTEGVHWNAATKRLGIGTVSADTALDVTGTITADGLIVDGDTVTANAQNAVTVEFNNATGIISADRTGGNYAGLSLRTTAGSTPLERLAVAYNGDISFYEATGTTPKMVWKAADERLGIGTSSPSQGIHLKAASGNSYIKAERTTANQGEVGFNTDNWYMYQKTNDTSLHFYNTADRMTIDSSGNVGIGAVPEAWASGVVGVDFGTHGALIDGTNVILSRNSYYDGAWKYKTTDHASSYWQGGDGEHIWQTAASGSADAALTWVESMRIDSAGKIQISNDIPIWSGSYGGAVFLKGNNATAARNARLCIVDSTGAQDGNKELILDNDGDVTVKGGDLIFGTAGKGIVLGATTNVAANTLDDYEEGTWTPTYTGSSTSPTGIAQFVDARYTVVGRAVHCVLHTYMSAFTGGSGDVRVNLPFTGNSATKQSGAFGRTADWGTTKAPRAFFIEASGTFLTLLASESADARDNINDVVQWADMTTYDEIYICFTYFLGT